jgi:hypothetical protein
MINNYCLSTCLSNYYELSMHRSTTTLVTCFSNFEKLSKSTYIHSANNFRRETTAQKYVWKIYTLRLWLVVTAMRRSENWRYLQLADVNHTLEPALWFILPGSFLLAIWRARFDSTSPSALIADLTSLLGTRIKSKARTLVNDKCLSKPTPLQQTVRFAELNTTN